MIVGGLFFVFLSPQFLVVEDTSHVCRDTCGSDSSTGFQRKLLITNVLRFA